MQGGLFDEDVVVALQTWILAPPCAFGRRAIGGSVHAAGWLGDHHCDACCASTLRACEQFAADVRAGKYDAEGYTPAERKAQRRRVADDGARRPDR